jgi:hypothetical protein
MTPASGLTVGVVPLEGRGSLPFVDLHREALFLHAVRSLLDVDQVGGHVVVTVDSGQRDAAVTALERADVLALVQDARTWWRNVVGPVTVVLHDPLCPLVPASFIAAFLDGTAADGRDLVAFRPVTDTIKTVVEDHIADTLDRDLFGIVASPVVFHHPGAVGAVGRGDLAMPPTDDFGALATWLRARGTVLMRKAPSLGRRVDDASAVNLLECMDELSRTVRET